VQISDGMDKTSNSQVFTLFVEVFGAMVSTNFIPKQKFNLNKL
jgi:hypothetical protein